MEVCVEVCVDSKDSAIAAVNGGSHRLEICSQLRGVGGLTPSMGLVKSIISFVQEQAKRIELHVMVRPRAGSFIYSDSELETMKEDIKVFSLLPEVDGIVTGALSITRMEEGGEEIMTLDKNALSDLRNQLLQSGGKQKRFVIHRCIDVCSDPVKEVETALSLGVYGILSSGGASTALQGVGTLQRMTHMIRDPQKLAEKEENQKSPESVVQVIGGGGISPKNVKEIVTQSGVRWIHLSAMAPARTLLPCDDQPFILPSSLQQSIGKQIKFGAASSTTSDLDEIYVASYEIVKSVVQTLQEFAKNIV